MTHTSPLVSIGMPVYNGEPHLRQALESLLGQDYQDFELLISDNASTDATPKICQAYAAKDPRVVYRRHTTNLGHIKNFNLLPSLSRGVYFMWAAHDDLWDPRFLSTLVHALSDSPAVVLAFSEGELFGRPDGPRRHFYHAYPDLSRCSRIGRIRRILRHRETCAIIYGLYRREVLLQTGLLRDIDFPSDLFLHCEIAAYGPILVVPATLFYKREGGLHVTRDDDYYRKYRLFGSYGPLRCADELPLTAAERLIMKADMVRRIWREHPPALIRASRATGTRIRALLASQRVLRMSYHWLTGKGTSRRRTAGGLWPTGSGVRP